MVQTLPIQQLLLSADVSLTSIKFLGPMERFLALASSCMDGLLTGVLPAAGLLVPMGESINLCQRDKAAW